MRSLVRLANVALRGLTLFSKLALVFFLAKFLAAESLGLYGLLAATVGYGVYAVGFEFYTATTRELIGRDSSQWLGILRHQAVFHFFTYACVLPVLVALFVIGTLPWQYLPWVIALLFLEHLGVELNRILIAVSEPLFAGSVLFVRSGGWCIASILVMWRLPQLRTLDFVLLAWTIGGTLACSMGLARVLQFRTRGSLPQVDWHWIRSAVKVAAPLLLASLALRGIFTVDRYWVESIAGLAVLGAYVLFMGMATAVLSFLDAAVIDFSYPGLVAAAKHRDDALFRERMRRLVAQIVITIAALVSLCWLLSGPLLRALNRVEYLQHRELLAWLLTAVAVYGFSMIPHVGLYAWGRDRPLLVSQLAGFGVFVAGCALLTPVAGAIAIPVAMCAAFCIVFWWKLIAYVLMRRETKVRVYG